MADELTNLFDVSDRTQIELLGDDRAAFLHNLCTNEVRKLPVGQGCEAFLLDAKGHVRAFITIFAAPHAHVVETVPGQGEFLLAHLGRYLIRERVEIVDRSADWFELLLAGADAERTLREAGVAALPVERLAHTSAAIAGSPVWVRCVEMTNPGGYLIAGLREAKAGVSSALTVAGAVCADAGALEAARIEAGWPSYGADITEKNLPQEVGRDATAISFTKGCYLGQETVARIDALGHVNRCLVRVQFAGDDVPPAGAELAIDGHAVGKVTSAAWSARLKSPVALGYVRRGSEAPGTRVAWTGGTGDVVDEHENGTH